MNLKKIISLVTIFLVLLVSCNKNEVSKPKLIFSDENINSEALGCFNYFWEQTETKNESAYGLVRDRYPGSPNIASIASTGFGLTSIPIGIESGWITYEEGKERVEKTLETLNTIENINGFYYHFLDMTTGLRAWNSELSVIDTGILMCGVLFVGEYFGSDIKTKAEELYKQVDWNFYIDKNKNMYYMSYSPEKGFAGYWDVYAEQLMLYVLGAGSPTYTMDKDVYYKFTRLKGSYGGNEQFIHSWFGSIFTYQFSHAWIDFRNIKDEKEVNWFENSVIASKTCYDFCVDNKDKFQTFSDVSWGLTAGDSPTGYNGLLGFPPSGSGSTSHKVDGTVVPAGAFGSIVFTPSEVINSLKHFQTIEKLNGQYGVKDAYNLDKNWYAEDYIGIDKGITLLMFANYENGFVWDYFMKNEFIQQGLKNLNFN